LGFDFPQTKQDPWSGKKSIQVSSKNLVVLCESMPGGPGYHDPKIFAGGLLYAVRFDWLVVAVDWLPTF
jgi:hypothetical protein